MYERILVPTDGSEGMDGVIEQAVELATVHDATIHAVYVINTASFANLPMETSWDGVSEMLSNEGNAALDEVETLVDGRVPLERSLLEGAPSREIVRYAENENCDLIFMGTHGRGGIDRLLLGSVAEKVVRTSDVPVLTVRVSHDRD
ncbi:MULTISPECIES: universal stress protein [unclassified Haladaptatus]|uniref:universal stress protein n=1 Tax=unclassified Haladaptatus TaxID=2622732 RepID=UPI0023E8D0A9|nr:MULTISPECIES: universal stress protein [unclassified Haladaptatus]